MDIRSINDIIVRIEETKSNLRRNVNYDLAIQTMLLNIGGINVMIKVVGVRFKTAGKVYYFDPTDIDVKLNDFVIVETAEGLNSAMWYRT